MNKQATDKLKGMRVELIQMEDPHTKLKKGDKGTVDFVDDIGQLHVKWDSGSTLALIPGVDIWKLI